MESSTVGYILLKDSRGTSKSIVKKYLPGANPYTEVIVLRGELVTVKQSSSSESKCNYQLRRDPSVYVYSAIEDIAPLNQQEFLLMEGIEKPADRMEAFNNGKLDWGINLKQGFEVYVTLNSPNAQYTTAVVHFKGEVGNVPGIQFGVELLEGRYRTGKYGTTDGTFQNHRYFKCPDNCGLFVSLARLSQQAFVAASSGNPSVNSSSTREASKPRGTKSYAAAAGNDRRETESPADNTRSKSTIKETSVDARVPSAPAPSEFHIGQRVKFYDKTGKLYQGEVFWLGRGTPHGIPECNVAGVKTDNIVFRIDFEHTIPPVSVVSSAPKNHLLFLPESLMDHADDKKRSTTSETENVEEMKENEALMKQQEKLMAEVEKSKRATDKKHPTSQNSELEKLRADRIKMGQQVSMVDDAAKIKRAKDLQQQSSFDEANNQVYQHHQDRQRREENRIYDEISDLRPDPQGWKSHPDAENRQALHGANYENRFPQGPSYQRCHDGIDNHRPKPQQPMPRAAPPQQPYDKHADSASPRDSASTYQSYDHDANLAHTMQDPSTNTHKDENIVAKTGGGGGGGLYNHNLEVGSLVQMKSNDTNPRYGTIKWIGNMDNVQGTIAGIELDEEMDGCTDGTFERTGKKFFNCPERKGIYYPLESLKPDERYATEMAVDGNPLRNVTEEVEQNVSNFIIDQYLGEGKGIQGDQNSCYLDATVFGLFALSIDFDDMFLQGSQDPNNTIGQILWKNIVNPLRMHGVVKFESVMKLRKELESLGRMKGITKDEKDPEEFLNMMFKHTLHTQPFISIRRPFGVEQEYFVQLFFEMDESMSVPTISDLLKRMFHEQQISFTEVPSKLLIQVPRFGKKFKTFQKIIPSELLNVADVVDLEIPYICHICGEKALKLCGDCMSDFQSRDPVVHFCEDCCEKVHQHPNRKDHHHGWCEEMDNLQQVSNLELLSVICIETSHYVCFTRRDNRWIFFDSMANRVYDKYNIPKVNECTADLNEWVYPKEGDINRLLKTPPRELPELVRRFTQDIYMCVYVQPDLGMY